MNTLILKLGATGDVVRTTTLLRRLEGNVVWITSDKNKALVDGVDRGLTCLSWDERVRALDRNYDLIVNLEDETTVSSFLREAKYGRLFGAYLDSKDRVRYTEDSHRWFDMSLISIYGRAEADQLKLRNRLTYQDLIFGGLGLKFSGEEYVLPPSASTNLHGDVALSPMAGPVWPMKAWAYYKELQFELEARGLKVNILPTRPTLIEHLADVRGHRALVSGDSLPMHLALGSGVKCVSIFTCTSPWEIYDYGIQRKLVSPVLSEFFYKRDFDLRATSAIGLDEVLNATLEQLK